MSPNPSTGLVTLLEVVMGELAGKFGEISLYNQHTDFELIRLQLELDVSVGHRTRAGY
jgi:hypothetical protein